MLEQTLLLKANSDSGRCSAQLSPHRSTMDLRMAYRVACEFSTLPLARGLCVLVSFIWMSRRCAKASQNPAHCRTSLSAMIMSGPP